MERPKCARKIHLTALALATLMQGSMTTLEMVQSVLEEVVDVKRDVCF